MSRIILSPNISVPKFYRTYTTGFDEMLLMLSMWFACKRINRCCRNKSQVLDFRTPFTNIVRSTFLAEAVFKSIRLQLMTGFPQINTLIPWKIYFCHLSKYQCVIDFWYNEAMVSNDFICLNFGTDFLGPLSTLAIVALTLCQ